MSLLPNNEHDERLQKLVGPRDWQPPQPRRLYDLVVVGGGTAGLVSAAIAVGLGAKVALIESNLMGGDCLNYGCVPSKALLAVSHRLRYLREASEYGMPSSVGEVDFSKVMQRLRRLRADIAHHDGAQRFTDLGVDVFIGHGEFLSDDTIHVEMEGGALRALQFKRCIVATGAHPTSLPIAGIEDVAPMSNHDIFNLEKLPSRLAIIGAGPIGIEMAQAFARFGSEVSVIALDDQVLPREDNEAAQVVNEALQEDGVKMFLGAQISKFAATNDSKQIHFELNGQQHVVEADEILLATGRAPNVDGLGLDKAGIAFDRYGVKVDDKLRTSNKRIYAAGDVIGSFQFTHAADAMARIVVRNAFFFGKGKLSDLVVPWATYCDPELAHVGLNMNEVDKTEDELEILRFDFKDIDRNLLEGETKGFVKVIFEKKSGVVRGATVVGNHAGDLIGEMTLAVQKKMKLSDFSSVIHAYPTTASIFSRLGDKASGARLTPGVAKLLKKIISWRR
ncbi:MAG: pyruvate/2-oxoglutarate dehydrogenase complex dihydrolipoamide dehydrogenase (E3) component [Myxococcota bacterium]|jgi:pyruvate/2-oxoglutarate dehydrogenase complex dihydrolipoamide dehydrogenase (E3) component